MNIGNSETNLKNIIEWQKLKIEEQAEQIAEMQLLIDKANEKLKVHFSEVSGQCHKLIEKELGDIRRQFLIWHDGGQWIVSLIKSEWNGHVMNSIEQVRTLKEFVYGIDA